MTFSTLKRHLWAFDLNYLGPNCDSNFPIPKGEEGCFVTNIVNSVTNIVSPTLCHQHCVTSTLSPTLSLCCRLCWTTVSPSLPLCASLCCLPQTVLGNRVTNTVSPTLRWTTVSPTLCHQHCAGQPCHQHCVTNIVLDNRVTNCRLCWATVSPTLSLCASLRRLPQTVLGNRVTNTVSPTLCWTTVSPTADCAGQPCHQHCHCAGQAQALPAAAGAAAGVQGCCSFVYGCRCFVWGCYSFTDDCITAAPLRKAAAPLREAAVGFDQAAAPRYKECLWGWHVWELRRSSWQNISFYKRIFPCANQAHPQNTPCRQCVQALAHAPTKHTHKTCLAGSACRCWLMHQPSTTTKHALQAVRAGVGSCTNQAHPQNMLSRQCVQVLAHAPTKHTHKTCLAGSACRCWLMRQQAKTEGNTLQATPCRPQVLRLYSPNIGNHEPSAPGWEACIAAPVRGRCTCLGARTQTSPLLLLTPEDAGLSYLPQYDHFLCLSWASSPTLNAFDPLTTGPTELSFAPHRRTLLCASSHLRRSSPIFGVGTGVSHAASCGWAHVPLKSVRQKSPMWEWLTARRGDYVRVKRELKTAWRFSHLIHGCGIRGSGGWSLLLDLTPSLTSVWVRASYIRTALSLWVGESSPPLLSTARVPYSDQLA